MAFADPQSVTINTVAKSMPRIETSGRQSVYQKDDGTFKLKVSHTTKSGRIRSLVRLDQTKDATDPYSAETVSASCGVWMVMDRPSSGYFTAAEIDYIVQGLAGWLSSANVLKVAGQES
jgi:hypothetical protein